MNIMGKRVMLRALDERDIPFLHRLINDPAVESMVGGTSFPVSLKEQEQWLIRQRDNRDVLRCAITLKENEENAFGTVFLSDLDYKNGTAQIHIKLLKEYSGNGYGAEAIVVLSQYAFQELRMNCIYAEVLSHNEPSRKMFSKCGYKMEGILRQRIFKNGKYTDVCVYSLLAGEV